MLKPSLKPEILNDMVLKKLNEYGLEEDDYRIEAHKYRTEEHAGIPYLLLLIKKNFPEKKQMEIQMDLQSISSSICVIFKPKTV
jgi:hypothetical protein